MNIDNSIATILIVEDEISILNNIATILELGGYRCLKASSVAQAFEQLSSTIPQLILSDVMMPETDGISFLKLLSSSSNYSNIPFCFLSAMADIVDIDNSIALGAKAYITKPFTAKDLLQTVARLLNEQANKQ
jgi:CheY-like chemotaxis protein